MNSFRQALGRFLTGEIEFGQLQAELDIELATNPAIGPEVLALLKNLYAAGRLPQQLYESLGQRVLQTQNATQPPVLGQPPPGPGAADAEDDGRTRLRTGTSTGAAPQDDDTSTRLKGAGERPVPRPGPAAGQTVPGGVAPGTDRTAPTGHSWSPDPTGRTGVTGQTGQTGATGQTGQSGFSSSSWAHPEDWSAAGEAVPTVGSLLKGRFVLESIIGHGGMGIVFKAKDLRKEEAQDRNPYIAVKILNEEFKKHPESLKALQRESRKAQDLAHPNIVTVFDFDREGGNVFMTMEYLEGESLDRFLKRYKARGLPIDKALPLIRDMAAGLAYAHERGIVHSDFKPANAFLTKAGVVKIFDFGIARAAKHSGQAGGEMTLFDAGTLGALTPAYATISMIEGGDPDQRDDIYALGCVAYELFTGDHPYGKRSALKARNAGMAPKQIAALTRRQWRYMQKALSFERKEQPATVLDFMDGLEPKKINKAQAVVGGIAAILVIGILVTWVPSYLHERHLDQLIATIESGEDSEITLILDELQNELSPEDQSRVYRDNDSSRDALFDYIERGIATAVDPARNAYDYATAEAFLVRAEALFPDSARVAQLVADLEQGKNEQIEVQVGRLDEALAANRLLSVQGAASVEEVLGIIAAIEPNHPRLADPRLPPAFARQAQAELDAGNLALAADLVNAGLAVAPADAVLVNVRDAVGSAVAEYEAAQRLAALERDLAGLGPASSIEEFRGLLAQIAELSELSPSGNTTRRVESALESVLAQRVRELGEQRDFPAAEFELAAFEGVTGSEFVAAQRESLRQAEQRFLAGVQNALGEIQQLASTGGFSPPNQGLAEQKIQALAGMGADATTLAQARQAVLQGFLQSARTARGRGDFDTARQLANLGLQHQPDATMADFLNQELADIGTAEQNALRAQNEAERQRLETERAAEIADLEQQFESGLAAANLSLEDGRRLANTVDRLRGLGATGDVVQDGRDRIAAALQRRAEMLRDAGDWEAARALASGLQALLPDVAATRTFAASLEQQFRQFQQDQEARGIAAAEADYRQLMARTTIDRAWLDEVWRARESLSADPAFLQRSDTEIAAKLAAQIQDLADADRFSVARQLLERGVALLPANTLLADAGASLQRAEAAFAEQAAAREQQARLLARVQTVRDQASANNIADAQQTLDSLRADLPANHPIFAEAPRLLADAHIRLAQTAMRQGQFDRALAQVDAGRRLAPDYAPLQELAQEIGRARQRAAQAPAQAPAAEERSVQREEPARQTESAPAEQQAATTTPGESRAPSGQPAGRSSESRTAAQPQPAQEQPTRRALVPQGPDTCANPAFPGMGADSRAVCRDRLSGDREGPRLVVIPAGGPAGAPFAITKYEITISDYNAYCDLSGACTARSGIGPAMPVTEISLEEAQTYAAWLSETTGFEYRLPTSAEWEYAATAPGTQQPTKNVNCKLRSGGQVIKGISLEDVRTGENNGWGLQNYVGNAREWVLDPGGARVRGGSFEDSFESCEISLNESHSGNPDAVTSFRLIRLLAGSSG